MRRLLSMLLIATASILGLSACEAPEPTMMELVKVPGDASTITEALRLVTPGGVIMVAPGRYLEQVEINKPDVTIRGEDRNLTIIDGGRHPLFRDCSYRRRCSTREPDRHRSHDLRSDHHRHPGSERT
ncbi:MAG: hypothetical protein KF742_09440 [Cryobacterium sp.]|nr:hypothetical protein [Cryobacterium sp.]